MDRLPLTGVAIALGSGLAIGFQATLFTLIGRTIGPVRASLVLNITGGILAGLILLGVIGIQGHSEWQISRSTLLSATIAVGMGIGIVIGIAFSFQQTGVAAGVATLFLGQVLIGIIVDALGWSGGEPIPLDPRRIFGLLVMALAIVLLVRET
ncbi:MAG: DMT family transporter [Chloroflexi bacterium]|nr:DMT family transporter [Chloroflexota bacterium]